MNEADVELLKSAVLKYQDVGYIPVVAEGAIRGLGTPRFPFVNGVSF